MRKSIIQSMARIGRNSIVTYPTGKKKFYRQKNTKKKQTRGTAVCVNEWRGKAADVRSACSPRAFCDTATPAASSGGGERRGGGGGGANATSHFAPTPAGRSPPPVVGQCKFQRPFSISPRSHLAKSHSPPLALESNR